MSKTPEVVAAPTVALDQKQVEALVQPDLDVARTSLAIVKTPGWKITTDEQYATVGNLLKEVKRRSKALEETRKSISGPLYNAQRAVNALFAVGTDPLNELETLLKQARITYDREKETARLAAMHAREIVPAPAPPTVGISKRVERRWRVKDPDKVPRQWCSPDPEKINAYLKGGGIEAIAGIEFYDHETEYVRT